MAGSQNKSLQRKHYLQYIVGGGAILLPVNCIWEFLNLVTWKSQDYNLENRKI